MRHSNLSVSLCWSCNALLTMLSFSMWYNCLVWINRNKRKCVYSELEKEMNGKEITTESCFPMKITQFLFKYSSKGSLIWLIRRKFPNHEWTTVPTFNSCTKCVGWPGIIHDRTPDFHQVSWVWMQGWPHNWT